MPIAVNFLRRLLADESGISSVEYALLLAFIAGAILIAADQLATAVSNRMTESADCIETGGGTC